MSTYHARKRGSVLLDGVSVPFEKGMNVTALAASIPMAVLAWLLKELIWGDVSEEIEEAKKQMDIKLKELDQAKKAKVKK